MSEPERSEGESNGGAPSKKSEPVLSRMGAAAEKPSGWGQTPRSDQTYRPLQTISNCSFAVLHKQNVRD